MIEYIEGFPPKLELLFFGDREIPVDGQIGFPRCRISQRVPHLLAERAARRGRECSFVEPYGGRAEVRPLDAGISDLIPKLRPAARSDAGIVRRKLYRERSSRLNLRYSNQAPVAEDRPHNSRLPREGRQIVDSVEDQRVR